MPNHITNELSCDRPEVLEEIAGEDSDGEFRVDFGKIVPMPSVLSNSPDCEVIDWARFCMGHYRVSDIESQHGMSAVEPFKAGNYGGAADALKASIMVRFLCEGNMPKDWTEKRFEDFIGCLMALRSTGHPSWYDWSIENWGTKWNAYSCERRGEKFRFETAWSAPLKFLDSLSRKHPDNQFRLRWADEDSGANTGDLTVQNGNVISGERPDNYSPEAWRLCFELNWDGECPEEYERQSDGTYKYIEGESSE